MSSLFAKKVQLAAGLLGGHRRRDKYSFHLDLSQQRGRKRRSRTRSGLYVSTRRLGVIQFTCKLVGLVLRVWTDRSSLYDVHDVYTVCLHSYSRERAFGRCAWVPSGTCARLKRRICSHLRVALVKRWVGNRYGPS